MSNRRLEAVTLDVGNTLLYCDPSPPEIYATAMSRLGRSVEADDVAPVFRDAWAARQQQTPPGADRYGSLPGGEREWWGALLQDVLQRLDHDAPWEPLLEDLYTTFCAAEVWRIYDDTLSTIADLRRRGLRVAVISNWDSRLPDLLSRLELDHLFDTVTVSAIEGVEKPAPEIFESTLERLSVRAEQTLHVGDSPTEDYGGARAVGMEAVLVDRARLFVDGDYLRVDNLGDMLDHVG